MYTPPKKPVFAPAKIPYISTPVSGTGAKASYNPAPTVASLTSQLSEATLTISAASRALGFTGKASGFLAFAQALAIELKKLRSKK